MLQTHDSAAALARRGFLKRFFHDLATPLSAASLHLEGADRRVRKGTDPTESLATARAELSRAFDLFDLARDFLLEELAEPETIDFDALVLEVSKRFETAAVEGRTGARVHGRRGALTAALSALLVNAIEESEASVVRVRLEHDGGLVRAWVENPGSLGAGNPEMLFSPRAARAGRKWGMGLSRARLVAAEAGGSVTLEQRGDSVVAMLELPEEAA